MTFGRVLIYALFWLNIISFLYYLLSLGENEGWRRMGRAVQWLKASVAGIGVFYLGTLFTHDRFAFRYVFENSSEAQELIYKVSGVWAGQEGTFLLWLFFLSAAGVAFAYTMREYEGWGMMITAGLELTLCALLIHRGPFELMSEMVEDGLGMNPLLKNPWMAIHPPVVFLGYALAAGPLAVFAAGMARGDTYIWVRRARPWALVAWCVLGVGIFLGSYWAYEVLGWGGYWGWDPVENASLFPWIAIGALLHGMLLQSFNRRFVFWNAFMVVAGYFMVLYSTFLTRSGVLSDVSVHSFEGGGLYMPLIVALALTGALGAALLVLQVVRMAKDKPPESAPAADENSVTLYGAIIVFWVFFIFVFMGTNWPIVSRWFMENPSTFDQPYYNTISVLVGIPLGVLLALCPIYFTKKAGVLLWWPMYAGVAVGVAAAAACFAIGIRNPAALIIVVLAGASAVTNGRALVFFLFKGKLNSASYLAHFGVALILIGIMMSSVGSKTERLALSAGETGKLAGYEMKVEYIAPYEYGYRAAIDISGAASAKASLEYVAESAQSMAVNRPFIKRMLRGDLYLTPIQIVSSGDTGGGGDDNSIQIGKGQTVELEGAAVTFEGFDRSGMERGVVGAVLRCEYDGAQEVVTAFIRLTSEGMSAEKVSLEGRRLAFRLVSIIPDTGSIILNWTGAAEKQAADSGTREVPVISAVFQASLKPYIWLYWLGIVLVSIGSLAAGYRRFAARDSGR